MAEAVFSNSQIMAITGQVTDVEENRYTAAATLSSQAIDALSDGTRGS